MESMRDLVKNDLEQLSVDIFKMVDNLDETFTSIPEQLFSEYFLPKMLGEVDDKEWVSEWISICGSPSSPVRVIDSSKKTLFVVPPIMDSTNFIRESKTKNVLFDILTVSGQHSNIVPEMGTTMQVNGLKSAVKNVNTQQKSWLKNTWSYILNKYRPGKNKDINDTSKENVEDYLQF